MAVYICQIRYLCVTNEKIESSCVTCLGLYLKSGSSAHFLTWAETIRPLHLSPGIAWRWCAGHTEIEVLLLASLDQNFSHVACIFFHLVFKKSLCWLIGNMYPKVYWNKGQLLAAALWKGGESKRWSQKPNCFDQGHNILPLLMYKYFVIFEDCIKKYFSSIEWVKFDDGGRGWCCVIHLIICVLNREV